MIEFRGDRTWCYIHHKEVVVGVCALCLNQRLLVLASKQAHIQQTKSNHIKRPSLPLPKILAFNGLLNGQDIRHFKSEDYCSSTNSSQEEGSFISIKFEADGVASWDKGTTKKIREVVEPAKPRGTLIWLKRIGYLFQLSRWRRSGKHNMSTKIEGAKARYGWIKTITRRKTKE